MSPGPTSRSPSPSPARPAIAAFGELGLTGELRWVGHPERRVAEARKFGLDPIITPPDAGGSEVATLGHALAATLPGAARRPRVAA
jgi:DNA repair protein RadA/Sms